MCGSRLGNGRETARHPGAKSRHGLRKGWGWPFCECMGDMRSSTGFYTAVDGGGAAMKGCNSHTGEGHNAT